MPESPEAPEELPENFETKVIAQLTIYLSQEDKGYSKRVKISKMKELVFTFLDNNYVEFLQMLLAKHLQDKYKVMQAFKLFEIKRSHFTSFQGPCLTLLDMHHIKKTFRQIPHATENSCNHYATKFHMVI